MKLVLAGAVLLLVAMPSTAQKYKVTKEMKKMAQCVQNHPEWANADCSRIVDHDVWVGMTADMATASLGAPSAVNSVQTSSGASMQLVYERRANPWASPTRIYLYIQAKDCDGGPGQCKVSAVQKAQ